jgi:hypothetical protein
MSTLIQLSPASGITVGTTAVTSGTIGRVFFQGSGNVVQQSASLFWDNTNARLGVGATPDTSTRLDIRAQGTASTDVAFRVRNTGNTYNIIASYGNELTIIGRNESTEPRLLINRAGSTKMILGGTADLNISFPSTGKGEINSGAQGLDLIATSGEIKTRTSSTYTLLSGNFFGIGRTPSARLDVQAQGALSTDIAFRVRNSADTLNTFQITGDGKTKMQGSLYYAEFDPSNGLYIGNNYGNMLNFTGILQGTSWINNGQDGKLAVGRTTAEYRLDVLASTTNPLIPIRVGTLNGTNDGKVGIAFTTTWTGGQYGNVGGVLYMNHKYVGPTQSIQHCSFDFALNSLNTAPVTKASITAKSNILLGTPTEDLSDSHTIYIPNGTAPTASIAGGGKLYVEGGALKFRGSSGTITVVAPA